MITFASDMNSVLSNSGKPLVRAFYLTNGGSKFVLVSSANHEGWCTKARADWASDQQVVHRSTTSTSTSANLNFGCTDVAVPQTGDAAYVYVA